MQQFFIHNKLPGLNEIIKAAKSGRGNSNAYSRMKRDNHNKIKVYAIAADIQPMESAFVEFIWCEPDRRRDPDNITAGGKFVLDVLAKWVIPDDSAKHIMGIKHTFTVNKARPGVLVVLHEKEQ